MQLISTSKQETIILRAGISTEISMTRSCKPLKDRGESIPKQKYPLG